MSKYSAIIELKTNHYENNSIPSGTNQKDC